MLKSFKLLQMLWIMGVIAMHKFSITSFLSFLFFSMSFSQICFANNFVIADLAKGKEVTIPQATVIVTQGTDRTILKPTGSPQTIKFSIDQKQGNVPLRITIFDSNAERSIERQIDPTSGLLYPFSSLSAITVVGKSPRTLRIESDRPMTVAH